MAEKDGLLSKLFSRFTGKKGSEKKKSDKDADYEYTEDEGFEEERSTFSFIKKRPAPRSRPTIFRKVKRSSATKYIVDDTEKKIDDDIYETGYCMEVLQGLERGKAFNLNRKVISIGKLTFEEREGWILLDTSTISSEQATLKWVDKYKKFAIIHNRRAKTPTYVNNVEISHEVFTLLRDGDFIRLGNIELMVNQEVPPPLHNKYHYEEEKPYEEKSFATQKKIDYRYDEDYSHPDFSRKADGFHDDRRPDYQGSSMAPTASERYFQKKESTPAENTTDLSMEESHMFQVIAGPDKDKVFTISKDMIENKLIIGRKGKKRKDIEFSDPSILDRHARLTLVENWLFIALEDQRASIYINDQSIKMKGLEDGDIIRMGNTLLEHFIIGSQCEGKGATMEVLEGSSRGKIYALKKNSITIGRKSAGSPDKDIEFSEKDRSVSRNHASIEKKNNKYYIINQKSKNLTFLNGVHVTEPRPLVNGDKIKLGNKTLFLFKHSEAPIILRETGEGPPPPEIKTGKVLGQREIKVIRAKETLPLNQNYNEHQQFIDRETTTEFLQTPGKKEAPIIPEPSPPEEKVFSPQETAMAEPQKSPEDIKDMVFIPGGTFFMGINEIECDANPLHEIYIDDFYIDKYPVSNIEYERFIVVTEYESEGNWEEYFTDGKEEFPVVGITYNDAKAYAKWRGKRLPTEAEWEKAARGTDGRLYPWGNEWNGKKLCSKDGGPLKTVQDYPEGASPYLVFNMLGTVWEWTDDHYSLYPYNRTPVESLDMEVVIRGGEWLTELEELGVTIRAGIYLDEYVESVGFRCAK